LIPLCQKQGVTPFGPPVVADAYANRIAHLELCVPLSGGICVRMSDPAGLAAGDGFNYSQHIRCDAANIGCHAANKRLSLLLRFSLELKLLI